MTYTHGKFQGNTTDALAQAMVDDRIRLGYLDSPEVEESEMTFHSSATAVLPNEVEKLREAVDYFWLHENGGDVKPCYMAAAKERAGY